MTEPKPVTNQDVVKYASKKCKHCLGTGWLRRWVFLDEDHQERRHGFCGCATRRFNALVVEAGRVQKTPLGEYVWLTT